MRPELKAFLDGRQLPVIGDGALMAALGQARSHTMRDIVASIQAEQDMVIRAPAASVTYVEGGPGTGKTAVALHRAAYLLYQDRRRYAGGILIVSPTPLLVAYTEGVLPSLGEEGQVAIRAIGSLAVDAVGAEATLYDSPAIARAKGSYRMLKVLRKAARGRWSSGRPPPPPVSSPSATTPTSPPLPPSPPACVSSPSAGVWSFRHRSWTACEEPSSAAPRPSTCCAPAPASSSSTPCGHSPARPAGTPTRSWPPSCAPPSTRTSATRTASSRSSTPGGRS